MIDASDVNSVALFGSIPVLIIVLIWYFVFSVPEINECHEKGGQIVRIEGADRCMDTSVLKEIK
jgi:ABC-type amino acid transport system permease subunit